MGKKKFLPYIHDFRAFAILNIMLAHVWCIPSKFDSLPEAAWVSLTGEVLFHNSTIYFLFISGFLARYLSGRGSVLKYYQGKLRNVVIPYILFSVVFHLLNSLRHWAGAAAFFKPIPGMLLHGTAQLPYWYIPFIIPVFLATPLLLRIPPRAFSWLTLLAAFLPLLGTRTGTELSVGQFLYMVPVYLLGMYAAMDYPCAMKGLDRGAMLPCAGIAIMASIPLFYYGVGDRFVGVINVTESLFYIQKLALCLFFTSLFMRMDGRKIPGFYQLAICSFTLYFIHYRISATGLREKFCTVCFDISPSLLIPSTVLYAAFVCAVSLGLSMLGRKILGKYSRTLIGS